MEMIRTFWPLAVAFVATIAWLIRLEARSVDNSNEIKRLWYQRKEDLETSKQAREETNKMLSEIRDDIKSLISRVGNK
jgi:hypothetical protein